MCVSDYRLGRHIRYQFTPWLTTGGLITTIPRNPQRIRIEFHSIGGIATSASWANVINEDGATAIITLNALIRDYDIRSHGSLVQRQWQVTQGSGNLSGTIIEFFLDETVLQAHLDEFKGKP